MAHQFHELFVKRIERLTADAVAVTLAIPPQLRDAFVFTPGQFLTLKANVNGLNVRRSYSICSSTQQFERTQELTVGIKRVQGGVFSSWATTQLAVGDAIDVMPPDGRFRLHTAHAAKRLALAAGSGITPLLSMVSKALQSEPDSHFTVVYSNSTSQSIMFGEALQDLKDQYPSRLTLIFLLSRQNQEMAILNGRIDAAKLTELNAACVPMADMDEVLICGPEAMIETATACLTGLKLSPTAIHSERFSSQEQPTNLTEYGATKFRESSANAQNASGSQPQNFAKTQLSLTLDGKTHLLAMGPQDRVLDVALAAGLDLPYSCKGGVCCTCRARVLSGIASMVKNFTLEQWEIDKGFILSCQAQATTPLLEVSFDER